MKANFRFIVGGLVLLLALAGCQPGADGKIYGQFGVASGSTFYRLSLGGFPTGTIYKDMNYLIAPGSYYVQFTIIYDGYYFPGNSSGTGSSTNTSLYWYATYKVTQNKGSTPNKDGADKHFRLYLNRNYGLEVSSGDVTLRQVNSPTESTAGVDQPTGTTTWISDDGEYTITVTSQILSE